MMRYSAPVHLTEVLKNLKKVSLWSLSGEKIYQFLRKDGKVNIIGKDKMRREWVSWRGLKDFFFSSHYRSFEDGSRHGEISFANIDVCGTRIPSYTPLSVVKKSLDDDGTRNPVWVHIEDVKRLYQTQFDRDFIKKFYGKG